MEDPDIVRRLKRPAHPYAEVEHLGEWHRSVAFDPFGKRPTLAQLHNEIRLTGRRGVGEVDRHDIGMAGDHAEGVTFAGEPLGGRRVEPGRE